MSIFVGEKMFEKLIQLEERINKLSKKLEEATEEKEVELGGPGSGRRPGGGAGGNKPAPISRTRAARDRESFKTLSKAERQKEFESQKELAKNASLAGDTNAKDYHDAMAEAHASTLTGNPAQSERELDRARNIALKADKKFKAKK
jgi:hypothetical protein